jgi:hypothetical protein
MNIIYDDVWLKQDDYLTLPQNCTLVACIHYERDKIKPAPAPTPAEESTPIPLSDSYEILLIDRHQSEWRMWGVICATEKSCRNCFDLYLKQNSSWQSESGVAVSCFKHNIKYQQSSSFFVLIRSSVEIARVFYRPY